MIYLDRHEEDGELSIGYEGLYRPLYLYHERSTARLFVGVVRYLRYLPEKQHYMDWIRIVRII